MTWDSLPTQVNAGKQSFIILAESVLAKKMPGLEKVRKKERKKENQSKLVFQHMTLEYISI